LRGLQVAIARVGIAGIEGEGITVPQKVFQDGRGDREIESLDADLHGLHVVHPDHFTAQVEERTSGVAGIDLRGRLDVELAVERTRAGAHDALRHSAV